MGIVWARSKDSSCPLVIGGISPELRTGTGAGTERELPLPLRGGGDICPEEDGGDTGRAVWRALRIVEVLFARLPEAANGDEVRRRKVDNSEGEGGETAPSDPPEGVRE
jgi:hypothetical protein